MSMAPTPSPISAVREAMNIAINREAIQQVVMRGQSAPSGTLAPPPVAGWTEELDTYPRVRHRGPPAP